MRRTCGLLAACLAAWFCASDVSAADKKGTEVTIEGLKSRTPASWRPEEPQLKTRVYQLRVPKVEGDKADAQLVISYFGPGQGGTVENNLERWKSMFRAPEGKTADESARVQEMKVGDLQVTYLDQQGTFLDKFPPFAPNAKVIARPEYRRLALIVQKENRMYFVMLTGPARTVAQHKKGFDDWLKNFK